MCIRDRGYISPICGEAPTQAMYMKICLVSDVLDVITCAKFQKKTFRGYDFTEGRIFHFPWGTLPQMISPNDITHRPNPQKDHPWAEPRHLSHKPRKSVARFEWSG